jgi:hypothetical protein
MNPSVGLYFFRNANGSQTKRGGWQLGLGSSAILMIARSLSIDDPLSIITVPGIGMPDTHLGFCLSGSLRHLECQELSFCIRRQ